MLCISRGSRGQIVKSDGIDEKLMDVKKVLKDAKSQVEVRSCFAKGENVCHKRREQTKE